MPWTPPDDYEPMPNLINYLRSISPRLGTADFDMVVYVQWVYASPPGLRRTPAEAWRALNMTPAHARDAIDEKIVPMEIYRAALRRAQQAVPRLALDYVGYQPRPDLAAYLLNAKPQLNTAEFDMVVYWQWVHATLPQLRKTVAQAWRDLRMTPAHARDAIAQQLVPMEIYPEVLARAQQGGDAPRVPAASRRPAPRRPAARPKAKVAAKRRSRR